MEQIIDTKYTVVQERTLPIITSEIKIIEEQVYKTTLAGVIQIGERLIEAKEMVEHGEWGQWCEQNLGYSQRQAQRYIELSEKYGDENSPFSNATTWSHLSISKAYRLLSVPEEELEQFTAENDVEDMTVKELEEKIKALTAKNESDQAAIDKLQDHITKLEAEVKVETDDPEKLKDNEKEIEKLKKKVTKLEEQKTKNEEENLKSVEAAKEKAAAEAKERFEKETELIRESNQEAAMEIDRLQRKLSVSENTEIAVFKVKADQLQQDFNACLTSITAIKGKDEEQSEKMKQALKTVMGNMMKNLEE